MADVAVAASIVSAACNVMLFPIVRVLWNIHGRLLTLEILERERNGKAKSS